VAWRFDPSLDGNCSVEPTLPHLLHLPRRRSTLFEALAPNRLTKGVSSTALRWPHGYPCKTSKARRWSATDCRGSELVEPLPIAFEPACSPWDTSPASPERFVRLAMSDVNDSLGEPVLQLAKVQAIVNVAVVPTADPDRS
jgi:hypothetical protein